MNELSKNDQQKEIAEKLIKILKGKGFKVATRVLEAQPFYKAEDYHQDYYDKKETFPYYYGFVKRF